MRGLPWVLALLASSSCVIAQVPPKPGFPTPHLPGEGDRDTGIPLFSPSQCVGLWRAQALSNSPSGQRWLDVIGGQQGAAGVGGSCPSLTGPLCPR